MFQMVCVSIKEHWRIFLNNLIFFFLKSASLLSLSGCWLSPPWHFLAVAGGEGCRTNLGVTHVTCLRGSQTLSVVIEFCSCRSQLQLAQASLNFGPSLNSCSRWLIWSFFGRNCTSDRKEVTSDILGGLVGCWKRLNYWVGCYPIL